MLSNSIITIMIPAGYTAFLGLMHSYGYLAVFLLTLLENTFVPVPSEVILTITGYLSSQGFFNFYIAFVVALVGSAVGMAIAYYIGYILGKDVVYKHLHLFHIKKEDIDAFDAWFNNNASVAVFVSRLIPVVRALISFPAGFAKMDLKKFFFYSLLGSAIWDAVLMLFGFYLISAASTNAVYLTIAIGVFVLALYIVYTMMMKHVHKNRKKDKK